jgi:hypothetical protein
MGTYNRYPESEREMFSTETVFLAQSCDKITIADGVKILPDTCKQEG